MTDSWRLARGDTILHSADRPPEASSSHGGDNIIPAPMDIEKTNPTSQRRSDAKSNATRQREDVLDFALNSVNTENISSFVKQRETILTFPEKLMLLLAYVERTSAMKGKKDRYESIGWSPDGKVIVICDREHLSKTWLPLFFRDAKFDSFTRKLYRWGFRRTFTASPHQDHEAAICFKCDNFQRDDIALLSNMNSKTAEKERKRIARYSAASCRDKQDNSDAPQTAPGSSPLVHCSNSPNGSQHSTTQQGFQWSLSDDPNANTSSFQPLNGIDLDRVLHRQNSAARLERQLIAPVPTSLQHTHHTFTDHSSSLRAVADFMDRPYISQSQALQYSALSQGIPGNGQNSEPAELYRLSTSQRPDHVQSTQLNFVQLLQELQNYNSTIDNSLNSSLMQGEIPSILRQEIPPVPLRPTSDQSPKQALVQSLTSLLGSWQGATSSSISLQPIVAESAMNIMSVLASPEGLSNHSIRDSLLQRQQQQQQQQQQQGESNQRLSNPQVNMACQSRTVQSLLSEHEHLNALADWIRRNFT